MDATLKRKWVEALRSGEYVQGKQCLQSEGRYCCLGVLCVVAGIGIGRDGSDPACGIGYGPIAKLIYGNPNESLCDFWLKNDSGQTFAEIADWIEGQPL